MRLHELLSDLEQPPDLVDEAQLRRPISISMTGAQCGRLDLVAEAVGLSRSGLAVILIEDGLTDLERDLAEAQNDQHELPLEEARS